MANARHFDQLTSKVFANARSFSKQVRSPFQILEVEKVRSYTFHSLSDKEFEILACDLIGREKRKRFERFRPGRDGGIDGRFFTDKRGQAILQCKHWARTSVIALKRALKRDELPKVQELAPEEYFVATSLALTPQDKKDIASLFSPYMTSASNIYGAEDLNDLLANHPDIEKQHYKLWLSGTNVLEAVLHNAVLGRSDFALEDIVLRSSRYVLTSIHKKAEQKLAKHGVVIVTGQPGVGKTTLAEQLCLDYAKLDYQFVVVASDIQEAEEVYGKGKKQIFLFDDFLGRNYLHAIDRHEDSHIVQFIRRVTKDSDKRFVLTSRTSVLNQGKRLTDAFMIAKLDENELEVHVSALTPFERAQLLYNHVWFSALSLEHIEQILFNRRYREIIEHKSFNPRLVSFICDASRVALVTPTNYWEYITEKLANPADVWEHTFENQLDDYSRSIVVLVVLAQGYIEESTLRDAYQRFLLLPVCRGYQGIVDFDSAMKTLVSSILNRTYDYRRSLVVTLFNPSVADYVIHRIAFNSSLLAAAYRALASYLALRGLSALVEAKLLDRRTAGAIVIELATVHLVEVNDPSLTAYRTYLAALAHKWEPDNHLVAPLLPKLVRELAAGREQIFDWIWFGPVVSAMLENGQISSSDISPLIECIPFDELEREDFAALAALRLALGDIEKKLLEENIRTAALNYWKDRGKKDLEESDVLSDYQDESDLAAARKQATRHMTELLSETGYVFSESDVSEVIDSCHVDEILYNNMEQARRDADRDTNASRQEPAVPNDGIDDLFTVDLPR